MIGGRILYREARHPKKLRFDLLRKPCRTRLQHDGEGYRLSRSSCRGHYQRGTEQWDRQGSPDSRFWFPYRLGPRRNNF